MNRLLLCTDLDRTLIPNGKQPESPGVRALFSRFVNRDEVKLAYVSGRHHALIEQAIDLAKAQAQWAAYRQDKQEVERLVWKIAELK